jgi:thymidylate kinase
MNCRLFYIQIENDYGGTKLSKLNFQAMTLNELRRYVLAHRDDREAWDEFAARPRPNAVIVSADTPVEEQERIIKELVDRSK